jgi:hypothetical protein
VYHPIRLTVLKDCVVVRGTVVSIKVERDGDEHIRVRPDAGYENLLNDANNGLLVVEPVCVHAASVSAAQAACADDRDPVDVSQLKVGQHVQMEGRWVKDEHHGWNEIHPLGRWN